MLAAWLGVQPGARLGLEEMVATTLGRRLCKHRARPHPRRRGGDTFGVRAIATRGIKGFQANPQIPGYVRIKRVRIEAQRFQAAQCSAELMRKRGRSEERRVGKEC